MYFLVLLVLRKLSVDFLDLFLNNHKHSNIYFFIPFISLYYLCTMDGTSSKILNSSEKVSLIPVSKRRMSSFSPASRTSDVEILWILFNNSTIPRLLSMFIMHECVTFSNFYMYIWKDQLLFFFLPVTMVNYKLCFPNFRPTLHSRDKIIYLSPVYHSYFWSIVNLQC